MQAIVKLPEAFQQDADRFRQEIERLKRGTISAAQFRSFRVPLGVYEQREADTYMLRVRLPAGGVLPEQMRALAGVSRRYGSGVLHVTSRQDIQVHRVRLEDVPAAFEELAAAGLSTRGGGGNTVRNITACYDAGVCPNEVFDVSPYAVALTEFLLPDPLSYQLPRKYKIAFSGCSRGCEGVRVNDVGFVAERRNGVPGFAVYVGGGMGAHSRVGELLEPFVPAGQVHYVAEAVKRVFDQHGNRKNRNKARLRFLLEKIGLDRFRQLYDAELAELHRSGLPELAQRTLPHRERPALPSEATPGPGFAQWRQTSAAPQKQEGYYLIQVPLELGDITADRLEQLAAVVERHGEGMLRTTQRQNLAVRWVRGAELAALYNALRDLGLAASDAPVLRNLVACAGASTCRLGICLSRGLARAVRTALVRKGLDLDRLGDLRIHISGCPNACGRHPIADLGLSGAARRVKAHLAPHYVLRLGGKVAAADTRLAQGKLTVPARNVPPLVADLLQAFQQSEQCPDFGSFLEARGRQLASELAEQYKHVPDFDEDNSYYFDWGADQVFSLAGRGPGECGAGVFDLIEVDLASAREAADQRRWLDATVLAARALLVTRGQQGRDDADVLQLFSTHFLDEQLVEDAYRALIDRAQQAVKCARPADAFAAEPAEVSQFVQTVQELYDNMDPSLRFKPVTEPAACEPERDEAPQPAEEAASAPAGPSAPPADREADFRGVVCPLNYVKTKMVLETMSSGQILSVLLDSEGARNVPESAAKDGNQVLSVTQQGTHWRVVIQKA